VYCGGCPTRTVLLTQHIYKKTKQVSLFELNYHPFQYRGPADGVKRPEREDRSNRHLLYIKWHGEEKNGINFASG
jgi:hypothetical protein